MRTCLFLCIGVAVCLSAWASEPGEFLDCSDMVFHVPGLTCTATPLSGPDDDLWWRGSNTAFDNEGALLFVKDHTVSPQDSQLIAFEVHRRGFPGDDVVIASIPVRTTQYGWDTARQRSSCGDSCIEKFHVAGGLEFDPMSGRLFVRLRSDSNVSSCGGCFGSRFWIAIISGFASTFEILQTYTPTANAIGFHVPYMPEGFPAADSFDTYYGDLATVGDWSQAHPMQCGYPAAPPSRGDYFTVADPLPNPAQGQGRYYVTAVHHQGETRFGRNAINGVLSGRDPSSLPQCSQ